MHEVAIALRQTDAAEIVRIEQPREFEIAATGDLRGRGVWTLTPKGDAVHVKFDWRVYADRTPLAGADTDPATALPRESQLCHLASEDGPGAVRPSQRDFLSGVRG